MGRESGLTYNLNEFSGAEFVVFTQAFNDVIKSINEARERANDGGKNVIRLKNDPRLFQKPEN
jgi:hypothetical protein